MDKLKIEGFFTPGSGEREDEIISFTSFTLTKRADEHSYLRFTAAVRAECLDSMQSRAGQEIVVSRSGDCVFRGVTQSVKAFAGRSSFAIEVCAVSWSLACDIDKHERIFRNDNKTFGDILSSFAFEPSPEFREHGADTVRVNCRDEASSRNIVFPVMQHECTDFTFARQAADYSGCRVWVNDISETPEIVIARSVGEETLKEEDIRWFSSERNMQASRFSFETDCIIPLGSTVSLNIHRGFDRSFSGIVCEMNVRLDNGIFRFVYTADESSPKSSEGLFHFSPAVTLRAMVEDNNDPDKLGRVKLSFADSGAEELLSDNAPLVPVTQLNASKSGGLVYIPAKGDMVLVRYEQDALSVFGAADRSAAYDEDFSEPDSRYLFNVFGKSVSLTKEYVKITSGDNTLILSDKDASICVGKSMFSMKDGEICFLVNDTKILLNSDNAIINSDKVTIDGSKGINASSAKITLHGDTGIGLN